MSYHTFDEAGLGKLFSAIKDKVTKNFLPLAGGTMAGNLTGKWITGTRLRATSPNHTTSKLNLIAAFNDAGWLCSRTLDEIKGDIGAGNPPFIVTFKYDSTAKGVIADKSVADIYAAYSRGSVTFSCSVVPTSDVKVNLIALPDIVSGNIA